MAFLPMRRLLNALIVTISFLVGWNTSDAQDMDTTAYYQSYNNQITGRTFLSRKFTNFRLRGDGYSLLYRPNSSYNLGVGFTYQWITMNFGYGFDFLNPGLNKSNTRAMDLQFHPYGRKIAIDVLGQFYKGYRLATQDDVLRTDIRANAVGATIQYIFNHEEFSYRAAFLQSEWQKRSAGSWVAGFEIYAGNVKGDSSLVPEQNTKEKRIKGAEFVEFGPSVGYAYTYVYRQHFFVTGSASVSLDLGINKSITEAGEHSSFGFSPNSLFKVFAGYNSSRWAFTAIYIANSLRLTETINDQYLSLHTVNFRIHLAYRFKPSQQTRKWLRLKKVDDIKEIE
jgi:hypothetical protein